MMLALPEGYKVGPTDKRAKMVRHKMLGDEWTTIVYYRGYPAFELAKQFGIHDRSPKYFGRLINGDWQQFPHYTVAAKVMATKHRLGVKHEHLP